MRFLLLALALGFVAACSDGPGPTPSSPAWLVERPDNACPYADVTLARFRKLVESEGWRDPTWNEQGTLEAVHARTRLSFVLVPAGAFLMGSEEPGQADGEHYASGLEQEKPVHEVAVRAYLLSRTECHQSAWKKGGGDLFALNEGPRIAMGDLRRNECGEWCRRVGLRLPSEEEWEYACRAGSMRRWCFGDDEALLGDYAHYNDNFVEEFMPVGQKLPNAWGFNDMYGNAGEWCSDDFHLHPGSPPIERPPELPPYPVWRGGHSGSPAWFTRSAFRDGEHPEHKFGRHGFRPAADLPE